MTSSRTQKTLINARVGALCYLLSLVVSFFSRRVFLEHLGAGFLGFTGSVGSLLGFLNVAELGIEGVICMALYKPLFDADHERVSQIVTILRYLYRKVGLFIAGMGLLLSLFLPQLFDSSSLPLPILYFGYFTLLLSTLVGYFFNYHTILLTADQRNYLVAGYYQASLALKFLLQMGVVLCCPNLYLYFALELLFALLYACLLRHQVRQSYPWLRRAQMPARQLLASYPEVVAKLRQNVVHRLGGFVQQQATPLFVLSYVSLPMVAYYANYMLVSGSLRALLGSVLSSTFAGVGNLVAEGNARKTLEVYWELFSLRFLCAGFFAGCFFWLMPGFITAWLGAKYLLSNLVLVLIAVHLFLVVLRDVTDQFLYAYGLVQDVWSPLVEMLLFLLLSVGLGSRWELEGLLCAPVLTLLLVIHLWKPYFLFTRGFHLPIRLYACKFLRCLLLLIAAWVITWAVIPAGLISSGGASWGSWLVGAMLSSSLYLALLLALFGLCLPEFRRFLRRICQYIVSFR